MQDLGTRAASAALVLVLAGDMPVLASNVVSFTWTSPDLAGFRTFTWDVFYDGQTSGPFLPSGFGRFEVELPILMNSNSHYHNNGGVEQSATPSPLTPPAGITVDDAVNAKFYDAGHAAWDQNLITLETPDQDVGEPKTFSEVEFEGGPDTAAGN